MKQLLARLIPRSTGGRWAAAFVTAGGAALVFYLAFFVFGVHLIFVDEVVDEEAPEFVGADADIDELISEARGDDATGTTASASSDAERSALDAQIAGLEAEIADVRAAAMAEDTEEAMEAMYQQVDALQVELAGLQAEREQLMTPVEVEQAAEAEKQITDQSMSVAEHMLDEPDVVEMTDSEDSGDSDDDGGGVRVASVGTFGPRSHPATGVAVVLTDGTQTFLRFDDDFATDNGPDLNVYLTAAGPDASVSDLGADFVDLGDMKGNIGAQNYEIPADVDLDRYRTVAIWCVRFNVVFGTAELVPMN